jgi:hypothetical protein
VRADESDIDDAIRIIDPYHDAYWLPAMLNTARPSLRMLALPMARFTSAGVAQADNLAMILANVSCTPGSEDTELGFLWSGGRVMERRQS